MMMAASGPPPYLLTPIDNCMPRAHVTKVMFLPESTRSDVSKVVDTLREGLSKTLEAIPLLSGTVRVVDEKGAQAVTAPWSTIDDIFQVKDLRHEGGLEYQNFKAGNFSLENLDGKVVLPVAGLMKGEKTVMLVQVNIIHGGMIIALCMHHSFTDGNGTYAAAKVWAAYCRKEDGSRLVTQEMIDRERLMRGWESASLDEAPGFAIRPSEMAPSTSVLTYIYTVISGWLTARLGRRTTTTTRAETTKVNAPPQTDGGMFFFAKSKLAELKNMASAGEAGEEDGAAWVSTNDALCALLGCCIASARDEHIRASADRSLTIWMVVGARRVLDPPLPSDSLGNCLSFIRVSAPSPSVESTPASVAKIAHRLRGQIQQRDERRFRKVIAALSSVEDLTRVVTTPLSPPEDRVRFSSWANQGFYDLNWGDAVGAKIERVRLWIQGTGHHICVTMPELSAPNFTGEDCGLEVSINGFEKGLIRRLKQNEFFMRFAQWRCN